MNRPVSYLRALIFLAALLAITEAAAAADKRVALVIGNAAYAHVPALKTPISDAKLVAKTLREIGFTEVLEHYDLDMAAMSAALEAFVARAEGADWAAIYYVGHGIEVFGSLYLAPTDARLAAVADLERQTITLERLLSKPAHTQKLRLVMLDMPRASPFGAGTRPQRAAKKEPSPEGDLFIAYATQPGNVIAQSVGDNGAFALALARHMVVPGADLQNVFDSVRQDVMKATNQRQVVWTQSSAVSRYQFVSGSR